MGFNSLKSYFVKKNYFVKFVFQTICKKSSFSFLHILAAQISSRSLAVGWMVGWSVFLLLAGLLVHLYKTFSLSTYIHTNTNESSDSSDISNGIGSSYSIDISGHSDSSDSSDQKNFFQEIFSSFSKT